MDKRITYWFSRGYHDAVAIAAHANEYDDYRGYICTPRMAHDRYPGANSTDIDVYLNGYGDGLVGDDFRLNGAQQVAA